MQVPVIYQIIALFGAACCLIAYVAHQVKTMSTSGMTYNVLNLVGGAALAFAALHPFQAGFLVMEGTWTAASLYAVVRLLRRKNA